MMQTMTSKPVYRWVRPSILPWPRPSLTTRLAILRIGLKECTAIHCQFWPRKRWHDRPAVIPRMDHEYQLPAKRAVSIATEPPQEVYDCRARP